jgi:formylglycine-generating enzyme required for sulfatase activity
MKIHFTLLLILALALQSVQAQQISNVRATLGADGKTIEIVYDIINAQKGQIFDVKIYMSSDAGAWQKLYTGDLNGNFGKLSDTSAGNITNLRILYSPLNSVERLQADVKFKVTAEVTNAFSNFTQTAGNTSFEMIAVKGGTFLMGSNDEESDEKPVHTVTVSDFYIGKFEVTQKLWTEIMGSNPSNFKGDNLPVEQVSWNDIQTFLQKLNANASTGSATGGKTYRLPTEAEWEYAAGGGQNSPLSKGVGGIINLTKFAGTNDESSLGNYAWYDSNSGSTTHAVGTKSPNALGIYDMSGNVWEWCNDWFKGYPGSSGVSDYTGSNRVIRCGSWLNCANYCRATYRGNNTPTNRNKGLGFRLCRTN